MDDEATQPSTQQVIDPRRLGRNNSGLNESDLSDVICILHPASLAAYRVVKDAAAISPEHVLQNEGLSTFDNYESNLDLAEQETIIIDGERKTTAGNDLALRMSSATKTAYGGFFFGRNAGLCDIIISKDSAKRISNKHFRIFINMNSVLMAEDVSTNGTVVDDTVLKCRDPRNFPSQRMLSHGSVITIQSSVDVDMVKFIVRIPSREGHEDEYRDKFRGYVNRCAIHDARQKGGPPPKNLGGRQFGNSVNAQHAFGMVWNGGGKYNVVGLLGKGAFATVYQLATKNEGHLIAAKELEKKSIMKNGQMDQKIDNEMHIMQGLTHPNVVQYIDYYDYGTHIYIMMEYIQHGDLSGYIERHGRLSEEHAKTMARQVLSALAYLHRKNITHRDIKPDNILIKSVNPFSVAIADFGLAKLVKNNETFLKTFCGTLLWCAPEVYPHYQNHAPPQGTKRRRGNSQRTHNEYSQSVDIWSFAGVLWNSLCGKAPFTGTAEGNGRGMFNTIMNTALDPTPLRERGVSEECIDLLTKMLNTDPSLRLTDEECLRHPWLFDGTERPDAGLNPIQEEEEEEEEEAAEELSQLSLHDRSLAEGLSEDEEIDLDDDEYNDLLGIAKPSKRVKTDALFPRNQTRDRDVGDFMLEESQDSMDEDDDGQPLEESFALPPPQLGRKPLFGEISQRALQSSAVLGTQANVALSIQVSSQNTGYPSSPTPHVPPRRSSRLRRPTQLDGGASSPSLLGAESMVRELNMASSHSPTSVAATTSEPTTPKTPEVHQHNSLERGDSVSEATPKARGPTDRQIRLQKSSSSYYDPHDPSTHNLEYASRVSGVDFVAAEAMARASENQFSQVPDTMRFSALNSHIGSQQDDAASESVPDLSADSQFLRPPPRLGRLTATADSFQPIVLKIDKSNNSWGRLPNNTIVYGKTADTRIPKKAFEIYFHADGQEDSRKCEEKGVDWTKFDKLYTGITTWTSLGLWVNGVHLQQDDGQGRPYWGKLYTGDVITIFNHPNAKLSFECQFFLGAGKERRPPNKPFKAEKGTVVKSLLESAQPPLEPTESLQA